MQQVVKSGATAISTGQRAFSMVKIINVVVIVIVIVVVTVAVEAQSAQ